MFTRGALLALFLLQSSVMGPAVAAPVSLTEGAGWIVRPTHHGFAELTDRVEAAVRAQQMNVVNVASASEGARAQGIAMPGNRVIGVFRNDFARRLLAISLPAGVEAPIRLYLTENADGTATLSYRTPTAVLHPYVAAGGPEVARIAAELDTVFAKIVTDAAR